MPTPDISAKILYLSIGGALGVNARYWFGTWLQDKAGVSFPIGTLLVNVTGSFALGFLATSLPAKFEADQAHILRYTLAIGFVGAYTTFSTFELETLALLQSKEFFLAAMYATASMFVGLLSVWIGVVIGRMI